MDIQARLVWYHGKENGFYKSKKSLRAPTPCIPRPRTQPRLNARPDLKASKVSPVASPGVPTPLRVRDSDCHLGGEQRRTCIGLIRRFGSS